MPILSLKLMDASGLAMTDQTVKVLSCAALWCYSSIIQGASSYYINSRFYVSNQSDGFPMAFTGNSAP